mgnify:FL=1
MISEYEALYKRLVIDQDKKPKQFHFIVEYQFEYHRELAEQSGTSQPVPGFTEKLFKHWFNCYHRSLPYFRDAVYRIIEGGDNFEIISEHPDLKPTEQ